MLHIQTFGNGLSDFLRRMPGRAGKPFRHIQPLEGRMILCHGEPCDGNLVSPVGILRAATVDEAQAIRLLETEPALAVFPKEFAGPETCGSSDAAQALLDKRHEALRRAFFRRVIDKVTLDALCRSAPDYLMVHLGEPAGLDSPEAIRLRMRLTEMRRRQWDEAGKRLAAMSE
ncbi:MAG: hypothetical protein AB1324_03405 [Candidatus Micrarchaeota archaeon]